MIICIYKVFLFWLSKLFIKVYKKAFLLTFSDVNKYNIIDEKEAMKLFMVFRYLGI